MINMWWNSEKISAPLSRMKYIFLRKKNFSPPLWILNGGLLMIRTVDTLCCFPRHCQLLVSANCRALDRNPSWKALLLYIPAHAIASHPGSLKSSALLIFHGSTGCDNASVFTGRGKTSGLGDMEAFPWCYRSVPSSFWATRHTLRG